MRNQPPFVKDKYGFCFSATPALLTVKSLEPWWGPVDPRGFAIPGAAPEARWKGQTVVCIASGPSLTEADCALVRRSGLRSIVANCSWKRAPFADILFAMDFAWWQAHIEENPTPAEWWTGSHAATLEHPQLHFHWTTEPHRNSGARCIDLAIDLGAARVLLIGYDCSLVEGVHWHGPHELTHNPDDQALKKWHKDFTNVARRCAEHGVEVVNCSRKTALTCFPRGNLKAELKSLESQGRPL